MKCELNRIGRTVLLGAAVILAGLRPAPAQSTAFTYHGRLHDNGVPVNGPHDLRFTAYSAEVGGNVEAGPLNFSPVDVVNGLFTVRPDFGADVFTGPARWLHIEVRPTGGADFTPLIPRQEVTSSPYAIRAQTAGNVASGAVTANQLNTGGVAPAPGQFLSYNGGNLFWSEPGVAAGNIFSLNGTAAYYNGGNVGIGTSNPQERLTIAGVSAFNNGLKVTGNTTAGTGIAIENTSSGGHKYDLLSGGAGTGIGVGAFGIWDETIGSYRLAIDPGGRVGIGTTTPTARLTVRTTGAFSAYGIEHTDGTVRLSTYLDAGFGAWLGTRTTHALNFFVKDGLPSMAIDTSGNIVMTPNGGSGGYGSTFFGTPNGESGLSIRGNGGGANRADVRFNGSSLKLVAGPGTGPPSPANGVAITTAGNVGIGTDSPLAKLDVRGTTRTGVLTITGGSDLAEPFPMKEDRISKGSVVVIDDEHPGRLMRSERAYDRRVAGIISGANGINPGITLQQEGAFVDGPNVALSGRVYVQADAAFGAIKPGDLLTTSDTPGHAMKVTDHAKAQGAILGKAMSELKEAKGFVLVLVTLQ